MSIIRILNGDEAEKYRTLRLRSLREHPESFGSSYDDEAETPIETIAAYAGPTPHGIRVNLVYTPPELRGRGYASACVAALSQELLDRGRQFCFLFTDLANPTSNHIYQMIGYQPVSEVDMYRFGEGT